MSWTPETIQKVLMDINASVPETLRKNVAREVPATPTVEMVVNKLLEMDTARPELKEKLQTLKDAGEFSKKKIIENPRVTKIINEYISREIKKAIKEGRLPPKSKMREFMPEHMK